MSINNITFEISDNDGRIYAIYDGKSVGSIFFVKIGIDKIMISESEIDPLFIIGEKKVLPILNIYAEEQK